VRPEFRAALARRLVEAGEDDAVARFFEETGEAAAMSALWTEAIDAAARRGNAAAVRRLVALGPNGGVDGRHRELAFLARLLLVADKDGLPDLPAQVLEDEARVVADRSPSEQAAFARSLMDGPWPALGILVARGAALCCGDSDPAPLIGRLMQTRELACLAPCDPVEAVRDELLLSRARARDAEDALAHERESLARSAELVAELRGRMQKLEASIVLAESRTKRDDRPSGENGAASASRAEVELSSLRCRFQEMRTELKERHEERNLLRHQLEEALAARDPAVESQTRTTTGSEGAGDTVDDEDLFCGPEEDLGELPCRIPRFDRAFQERLGSVPRHVLRGALALAGRLAGGEAAAFRGAKRLRHAPDYWRQRLGDWRLLFRMLPDAIEIVDIEHRSRLQRRVESLRNS
jgi:mRNA-degrading endonuclease RelE of RelBE toxin-antitoxin system